jgi:hypothetical protein
MNERWWESPVCFVCDYWWGILIAVTLSIVALMSRDYLSRVLGVGAAELPPPPPGVLVEHESGTKVFLPPGIEGSPTITQLDELPAGNTGTMVLPGEALDIQVGEQEIFSQPISIVIPYDEVALPVDRTEAELFAVFMYEGEWIRLDGAIDSANNTITVDSYHASIWSWAFDKEDNAEGAYAHFLSNGDASTCNVNALGAQKFLVQRRGDLSILRSQLQLEIDDVDERVDEILHTDEIEKMILKDVSMDVLKELGKEVAYRGLEIGSPTVALTGAATAAGAAVVHTVSGVIHLVKGTITLFDMSVQSGDVIYFGFKVKDAIEKVHEAETLLYILRNPDVESIPKRIEEAALRTTLCEVVAQMGEPVVTYVGSSNPDPQPEEGLTLPQTIDLDFNCDGELIYTDNQLATMLQESGFLGYTEVTLENDEIFISAPINIPGEMDGGAAAPGLASSLPHLEFTIRPIVTVGRVDFEVLSAFYDNEPLDETLLSTASETVRSYLTAYPDTINVLSVSTDGGELVIQTDYSPPSCEENESVAEDVCTGIVLPDLVGHSLNQAHDALSDLNVGYTGEEIRGQTESLGLIVDMAPDAGTCIEDPQQWIVILTRNMP